MFGRVWLRAVLLTVSAAALLAAACSGGVSPEEHDALAREAALAAEAAQRAQLIAALEPLNPLRYHELDGIIRDEGRVPVEALIWAERARETLRWADWPPALREHAAQYAEWLDALLAPLYDADAAAAAEPSRIVHALAHTFEASLEAWLNGESVPPPPALAGLEPPMHQHPSESDAGGHSDSHESDSHDDDSHNGGE